MVRPMSTQVLDEEFEFLGTNLPRQDDSINNSTQLYHIRIDF
jgi:hypothetical protein